MSRGRFSGKDKSHSADNGSVRVQRVERSLREIISSYVISHLDMDLPGLVSIPYVRVTADLRQAKVYVSLIPFGAPDDGTAVAGGPGYSDAMSEEEAKEAMLEILDVLKDKAYEIQREISHKMQMKFCPKLKFFADDRVKEAIKVENLIEKVSHELRSKEENSSGDAKSDLSHKVPTGDANES